MREQADRVEEAFSRRVAETEDATRSLEAELKQVCQFFEVCYFGPFWARGCWFKCHLGPANCNFTSLSVGGLNQRTGAGHSIPNQNIFFTLLFPFLHYLDAKKKIKVRICHLRA